MQVEGPKQPVRAGRDRRPDRSYVTIRSSVWTRSIFYQERLLFADPNVYIKSSGPVARPDLSKRTAQVLLRDPISRNARAGRVSCVRVIYTPDDPPSPRTSQGLETCTRAARWRLCRVTLIRSPHDDGAS